MVPLSLAARCSRREAVIGSRAISATTAPSPPCRKPSSIQARVDLSSPASTWMTRSGGRPACSRPGANRSCCATHHSTLPCVRAAIPATKQAAARDLMQTAKSQSTAGQFAVQRRNAEGQHFPRASAITFKLRDSRTKGRNGWTDGALVHLVSRLRVFSRANPVVMFFICSDGWRESI